jgi:hypothetical protein
MITITTTPQHIMMGGRDADHFAIVMNAVYSHIMRKKVPAFAERAERRTRRVFRRVEKWNDARRAPPKRGVNTLEEGSDPLHVTIW